MADSIVIKLTGDDSEFQKTLSGVGAKASGIFKGMMASQIVTKGFSMLANGIRSAINTNMQFEATMSEVQAISGATAADFERLQKTAQEYGATTAFTASEAGEALKYMALAGWDTQQSIDALGGVLNLAAASGMELGAASDAVTDFLSAFGMEASQAGYMADLMAYAQANANTSASQLADAYGNCAANMHAAGQDIETTTAMLMALSNQGIKGSEAGTQMAAVMRDLTQKMDDGKIMIGETAVSVQDAQGNFRDLNDILTDVGAAVNGLGTAEASAALMTTFTARSVKAIQTLLNEGMAGVNAYEEALRGSEGTAERQAKTMLDNLQGDVKLLQSAIESMQIAAGESMNGAARGIVQDMTGMITEISQAGQTGGLDGMMDAFVQQLPKATAKLTELAMGMFDGIGKALPGLVRGLVGELPGMISGAADLLPGLVDALFEGAGALVGGLAGRLPELAGALGKGVVNLVTGAIGGVGTALYETIAGILGPDRGSALDKYVEEQFSGLNTGGIKRIELDNIEVDGEIDTEGYVSKVDAAKRVIAEAIYGLELGGDKETEGTRKEQLKLALMEGSGIDVLKETLVAMGVEADKAEDVATRISNAMTNINTAVGSLGLDELAQAKINELGAEGNTTKKDIQKALEQFGADPTAAATAAEQIQSAMDAVNATLAELGLDDPAQTKVRELMSDSNTTKEDIQKALEEFGVDSTTASQAATDLDTAMKAINAAIAGLGLDEAATTALENLANDGATKEQIQAALESMGVDSTKAELVASTITAAHSSITGALSNLGLSETQAAALAVGAGSDKALIAACLEALGVPEDVVRQITEGYDSLASGLSGKITGIYDEIYSTLTDGEEDTPKIVEALKQKVQSYYEEATKQVQDWANEEIAKLDINSDNYAEQVQGIKDTAAEITAELEAEESACQEFIDSMAGKSAAIVSQNKADLDQIMANTEATVARIEALNAKLNSKDLSLRNAVEQGKLKSQNAQYTAFAVTAEERERAILQAADDYAKAVEQANAKEAEAADLWAAGQMSDEEYNTAAEESAAAITAAGEKRDAAIAAAEENYDQHIADIIHGMIMADDAAAAAIDESSGKLGGMLAGQQLLEAVGQYTDKSGEEIKEMLGFDDTTIAQIAAAFGTTADEINAVLNQDNRETRGGVLGGLLDDADTITSDVEKTYTEALGNVDLSGEANVLAKAAEDGLLDGGNFDWSDPAADLGDGLRDALIDAGETASEAGAGIVEGVTTELEAGVGEAESAGQEVGQAAAEGTLSGAAVNSPSAISMEAGAGIAEGVEVGIQSGEGAAVSAAEALGQAAADGAKAGASDTTSVGAQIAAGVASGILSGRSAVVSAAISVCQAAVAAMRSALQISSPSRVTMAIGAFAGEGFGIGLSDALNEAIRSAQNVVGLANLSPGMDFSGLRGSMDAAARSLEMNSERPVNLYLNGRQVGRALDRDTAYVQNNLNRRLAMGVGR